MIFFFFFKQLSIPWLFISFLSHSLVFASCAALGFNIKSNPTGRLALLSSCSLKVSLSLCLKEVQGRRYVLAKGFKWTPWPGNFFIILYIYIIKKKNCFDSPKINIWTHPHLKFCLNSAKINLNTIILILLSQYFHNN